MEPHHRQALQRHLVDFMEDVDVDAGIVSHLQAAGVINNVMVDEINAYESKTKRTLAVVQMLPKRGHKAFATFVDALRRTGHELVAERLMKDVNFNSAGKPMLTTSPVYLSRRQDTPRVPQPNEPIAPPSSPINATDITEDSDFEQDLAEQHLRMKAYPMEKTVLGACLLINNHRFNDTALNRSHAKRDATQLQVALQKVGFKVLHKQNLTAKEMLQAVTVFCQSDRHHRSNCAMVVVISHATASGILGIDGALYSIHALISAICDVPSLLNKPKVFIFDACVGEEECKRSSGKSRCSSGGSSMMSSAVGSSRSGLWSATRPQSGMLTGNRERSRLASASKSRTSLSSAGALASRHFSTTSYSGFLNHNYNGAQPEIMDINGPESQDVDFLSLVPATTDIFLMRSKVEQPVVWKNVVEGCVLVQCFARVLTNYHKSTDMFGLYKMTKELVAMKEFRAQDEDGRLQTYRQSVEAVDRLKHILYFRFKPVVTLPSPDSTIEVIDLDQYTSPREEHGEGKPVKKSAKHVKFGSYHQVIPTDSKGRVLNGTEKVKTKFCVIL